MRHTILILALAMTTAGAEARADQIVTYNMTGTITSTEYYSGNLKFAVGDHISWTLQYNTSTPMYTYSGTSSSYTLTTPLITNIVDRTTGSSFYVPLSLYVSPYQSEAGADAGATLKLSGSPPNGSPSFFHVNQYAIDIPGPEAMSGSDLLLNINGPLPTFKLASLQLNRLPINWSTSSFSYSNAWDMEPGGQVSFTASVDPLSTPMHGSPEPGSLTLFLFGIAGLAVRGIGRRLGQVG